MSVTITITDPTEEEARRVADYLMELGGYRGNTLMSGASASATKNPFIGSHPTYVDEHPEIVPEPTDIKLSVEELSIIESRIVAGEAAAQKAFAAPAPAPFAPMNHPGTVELDAAGMPWDGRIHSDTKSKIGGGYWRTRRGADAAVVTAVTAELKAAMGAPSAPVPLASVPVPPPFVASVVPSVPPVPTTQVIESAGAAPTASPSSEPVPPVAIAVTTFPQLMMAITKGIGKGTFTQPDVVKAIEGVGLASIPMLASRPDLIPAVAAALGV